MRCLRWGVNEEKVAVGVGAGVGAVGVGFRVILGVAGPKRKVWLLTV
jgi:hypothetical protein